jgi:hypothetical protein
LKIEAVISFGRYLGANIENEALVLIPIQSEGTKPRAEPDYIVQSKETDPHAPESSPTVPASLKYILLEDGSIAPVWDLQIDLVENYYHAHIDARKSEAGALLRLIDWVSDASYNVYPLGINDPSVAKRELVKDPSHPISSPNGWHWHPTKGNLTVTAGNNVFAQENARTYIVFFT